MCLSKWCVTRSCIGCGCVAEIVHTLSLTDLGNVPCSWNPGSNPIPMQPLPPAAQPSVLQELHGLLSIANKMLEVVNVFSFLSSLHSATLCYWLEILRGMREYCCIVASQLSKTLHS